MLEPEEIHIEIGSIKLEFTVLGERQNCPCVWLVKHYAMKTGIAPPFLTSALDGGEWSASCPCHSVLIKIVGRDFGDLSQTAQSLSLVERKLIWDCYGEGHRGHWK
jgi:hypothetical protein